MIGMASGIIRKILWTLFKLYIYILYNSVLVLRLLSYMCTFAKQPAVEFSYIPIPLPWNGRGPFTDFLSQDISLVFGPQTEVVKSEKGRAKFPWRGANHEEACQPTTAHCHGISALVHLTKIHQ